MGGKNSSSYQYYLHTFNDYWVSTKHVHIWLEVMYSTTILKIELFPWITPLFFPVLVFIWQVKSLSQACHCPCYNECHLNLLLQYR